MMLVLLLFLGFAAVAAGMFGVGLGVPVKDTTFGAAVLVSSSVAITGGFILVGLAAAVSELRRVLQAGLRQMRLPDRLEADHGGRWTEPRLGVPGAPGGEPRARRSDGDAAVIPTRFDAPEAPEATERPRKPARQERTQPPPPPPSASISGDESHRAPGGSGPERFNAVRPSDFRRFGSEGPEQRTEAPPATQTAQFGTDDVNAPPLSPAEAAGPAAIRPVRVLKSGQINDVAYTLFSDGSIETQTPGGTERFGSIDEFRRRLEKSA
jgi:hypothetical protein